MNNRTNYQITNHIIKANQKMIKEQKQTKTQRNKKNKQTNKERNKERNKEQTKQSHNRTEMDTTYTHVNT